MKKGSPVAAETVVAELVAGEDFDFEFVAAKASEFVTDAAGQPYQKDSASSSAGYA